MKNIIRHELTHHAQYFPMTRPLFSIISLRLPHAFSFLYSFRYTRQVLDETLRLAVLAPWGARISNHDLRVGDYTIPKEVRQSVALQSFFKNSVLRKWESETSPPCAMVLHLPAEFFPLPPPPQSLSHSYMTLTLPPPSKRS